MLSSRTKSKTARANLGQQFFCCVAGRFLAGKFLRESIFFLELLRKQSQPAKFWGILRIKNRTVIYQISHHVRFALPF
jgi:hypothetical protein